ncbi:hypothetical protein CF88_18335 [Salmonella enterica subsp. enterica]|nr:hypothetical protein [Salmonella enterica subsp. enterica]EJL7665584.1 hypothetical protein [Salmonella enterica]EKF8253666.1 hypothetical protein [Salmonella enterica]
MIKGYLMAVSAVVSVCFIYGLLVPSLISAKSDLAFFIGLAIALIFPVALLKAGRRYINLLNKTKEK